MTTAAKGRRGPAKKYPYRRQVGFTAEQWRFLEQMAADSFLEPLDVLRSLIGAEAARRGMKACPSCRTTMIKAEDGYHCYRCEAAA